MGSCKQQMYKSNQHTYNSNKMSHYKIIFSILLVSIIVLRINSVKLKCFQFKDDDLNISLTFMEENETSTELIYDVNVTRPPSFTRLSDLQVYIIKSYECKILPSIVVAKNILALDVPVEKGKLRLKFPFSDLKSNCLVLMQEKNTLAEDLPRKSKIYIPGPVSSFKKIELRYFDVLLKAQLITEETKELKDKSHKKNETIIGLEKVNKKNDNLKNSTLIQETKNWLTLDGITSLHLQPVFISITNAILILAVGVSIIYISTLHDTRSSISEERNKNIGKIILQNPISSATYSGNIKKMNYKNYGKYHVANTFTLF